MAIAHSTPTQAGTPGNDSLIGGSGVDVLHGAGGNDTLDGGGGNDILNGGAGNDILQGGSGIDTAEFDSAVSVDLAVGGAIATDGSDIIAAVENVRGSPYADFIIGNAGANVLAGGGGNDVIRGAAGDDSLSGDGGNDSLEGGEGIDTALYGARGGFTIAVGRVTAATGGDTDMLEGVERLAFADGVHVAVDLAGNAGLAAKLVGVLYGAQALADAGLVGEFLHFADLGVSEEQLALGGLDERLGPDATNEQVVQLLFTNLTGSAPDGATTAYLAGFLDTGAMTRAELVLLAANHAVNAHNIGLDTLTEGGLVYQPWRETVGTPGADTLNGTTGDDHLYGLEGNDVLNARSPAAGAHGDDSLYGGAGNDSLTGGTGADLLQGDEGNDSLLGVEGDDTLRGGDGDDTLVGGAGHDRVEGGAGNDSVIGDAGDDTLLGGDGHDQVSFTSAVAVDLAAGTASGTLGGDDVLAGFERVTGSSDADSIAGAASGDELSGRGGNDTLNGRGGDDLLAGGEGNDRIEGGAGIDRAGFDGARASYDVAADGGTIVVQDLAGVEGTDTLTGVERLVFGDGTGLAFDLEANAGTVAKVVGAVFGADAVGDPAIVGIGLDLLDGGWSAKELMQAALDLQLGADATAAAVVDLLYTNLIGEAPSAVDAQAYVDLVESGTVSVAALGLIAADSQVNADNIDLVGLAAEGLAYT